MKITLDQFLADEQGRTYTDVTNGAKRSFEEVLELLSQHDVQQRLIDAEVHHLRPALAGAVIAIEALPSVRKVMEPDDNFAKRFRQATGVAVRIVMELMGWEKTGKKWSVGVGQWFSKAEHYEDVHVIEERQGRAAAGRR